MMKTLFSDRLDAIRREGNFRNFPIIPNREKVPGTAFPVNLSSNDYLGLAADRTLREEFLAALTPETFVPTASSSRLMTGDSPAYGRLENELRRLYSSQAALVLNSGYHANTGILPAVTTTRWLILADKLVHASLIDGIRLSHASAIRYRHNDYRQLRALLEKYASEYEQVVIVTESIFSMDGDECDLDTLVDLKREYPNVLLYLDEAHAVGVRGKNGLGCAEEKNCITEIDFLVGTFGKALASTGAFLICTDELRTYLINTMRTLVFTTALPPVNLEWSRFILSRLSALTERRRRLAYVSGQLRDLLKKYDRQTGGSSHIVPWITGSSRQAVETARKLQEEGFFVLPVRPPTVPEGSARLRFSLSATLTPQQTGALFTMLERLFSQEP